MTAAATRGIDLERLADFLAEPLELDRSRSLEAELIVGGRSNVTYVLREGDRSWILRRPPLGHRAARAHSMRREFTVLDALAGSDVPAPRAIVLCDDDAVIGAEFYVMERSQGRILRRPADVDLNPEQARRCSAALVEALAAIHNAPYDELGLASFGKPDGYLGRQVERWNAQLEGEAEVTTGLRELGASLARSVPEYERAALVHGDFRIDNVVLDPADPGRIVAVLDWEMATLGDPLADLGMLLMYWGRPGEKQPHEAHEITAAPGFYDRDELIAAYGAATGFELSDLDFFIALAHFKLAVIVTGIVARHRAGETLGDAFDGIDAIPAALTERGLELALR